MTVPDDPKPVAATGGIATLTPENSKVEFIGTHAAPRPADPRLGGFEKFTGQAEIDADAKTLKSVALDIDATSVWTQMGGQLTTHLKSPDFFDVNEFPKIAFKSTTVEATDAAAGKYTLTGDLTLHGVTKPISIPATIKVGADGLTLISQFTIDRTDYGMTYEPGRVEKAVSLTVVIGDKTQPKVGGGFGPGGPRGGPRGGPGGGPPGGPGGGPGGPPGGGRPGAGGPPPGGPPQGGNSGT
jgi:polyisoprenoid-binding protein YceI